jgi:hypothetical protein
VTAAASAITPAMKKASPMSPRTVVTELEAWCGLKSSL